MRRILFLLLFAVLPTASIFATHNVAGEITYKPVNSNPGSNCHEYEITVTTYTDMTSAADRCSLTVYFGDGTSQLVYRDYASSSPLLSSNLCGSIGSNIGGGMPLANYPNFKKNLYITRHTYSGGGLSYIISIKDPNRVSGICNIVNSVNIQFYLQSELVINDLLGCNSSPELSTLPLDKACAGHCFYHNPGAFDPDQTGSNSTGVNDSLSYSLSPCMDTTQQPLVGWSNLPVTAGGTLNIDAVTGLLTWCSPTTICHYNIVIRIEKFRKLFGVWYHMGYVMRDMQIDVSSCNNTNPILNEPMDTCILAGTHLVFPVRGTDPTAVNQLSLTASGDAFNVIAPAATFNSYPAGGGFGPQPALSTFNWQTSCDHIRLQPHQATFRLENNDQLDSSGNPIHLLDYETVSITVIAPAPTNLSVAPFGQTMKLNWTPEVCNPVNNHFMYYEIYRRSGCDVDTPGHCTTGVPAIWGYTLIGTTPVGAINSTSYVDNNNGQGLIPGVTYSYRVVASYADGAASQPSKNVCVDLKRDIPVITHVDVQTTSTTAGVIYVKWKNPIPNKGTFQLGIDTVAYPGPYTLKVFRSIGFSLATPMLIQTYTANFLYQLQDSLIDNVGLSTQTDPWSYKLEFYANGNPLPGTLVGSTQKASSVFLTLAPSDKKLTLSWQEFVPWTNFNYLIYKQNPAGTAWNLIGQTNQHTFVDSNLVNHRPYCYYVTAVGSYLNVSLPDTLLNRSEQTCMAPVDNTPPCPPVLQVSSSCESGQNTLNWTNPNHSCADDVLAYNIYYSPTANGTLTLIANVTGATDTSIVFSNLTSVAGCYAVTALDSFNVNESVKSNIVCVDNCPLYTLPNVFSPNGDNVNDVYNALLPFRYVSSVDMKIYDRWGVLLFQTSDPNIRWDGKAMQTGKLCTDGVYYYVCTVNSIRLTGIVPYQLKGFIQLIATPVNNR
jgi:gliding motility-associated-like protein